VQINLYSTALHDPRSTAKLLTIKLIEKSIGYIGNQHTKQAMTMRKVKVEFYKILNLITTPKKNIYYRTNYVGPSGNLGSELSYLELCRTRTIMTIIYSCSSSVVSGKCC